MKRDLGRVMTFPLLIYLILRTFSETYFNAKMSPKEDSQKVVSYEFITWKNKAAIEPILTIF